MVEGIPVAAKARGLLDGIVSAEDTRIHQMDQLFFRVAEQIPWEQMARSVVSRSLGETTTPFLISRYQRLIEALARANDLDEDFLSMELRKRISNSVFKQAKPREGLSRCHVSALFGSAGWWVRWSDNLRGHH